MSGVGGGADKGSAMLAFRPAAERTYPIPRQFDGTLASSESQ
ncbi:hypothetical protein [Halopelagius fulvigenes]|uniref:Uncharacterized protein n=1 Tax=Halopelagius fulvigenes TaxID=1198324 RepID=A0ABD5U804_9EURY